MKKVLFATTALVMTAGVAAAEVSLSGDGRMGMVYDGDDLQFTSRARVKFTLTGESDSGLSFGGEFRVDHEDEDGSSASRGGAGHVYISGAYGKLSMGDIDSASEKANGDLHGVGLTGLGDINEFVYLTSDFESNDNPGALYEYTTGAFTAYASMMDAGDDYGFDGDNDTVWSIGGKYAASNYAFGLGYEAVDVDGFDLNQWTISGEGTFGQATVKAIYSDMDNDGVFDDVKQYGLSVMYDAGATDVSAFYKKDEYSFAGVDTGDADTWGIGAAYDLGGGATLKGGIVDSDYNADTIADFGVAFTF
ncbi:porin [Paracoccus tegillarcae]|uniref:Porin n=1 Tax=Paracoccus tegillarcae TaxID=1529068 RepID=A0A2K9EEH3_9RHOB|nr:porin [Paracoccus tegillarcae]AUH33350.1 porin [Paracoccus tegillarcae]